MSRASIPLLALLLVDWCWSQASPAPKRSRRSTRPGGTLTVTRDARRRRTAGLRDRARGSSRSSPTRGSDSSWPTRPKLERGFRLEGVQRRSRDETWEQPWGERRFVRDRYKELRVRLVEKRADGRRLDVVFRAFDDGVGFRYEFPGQEACAKSSHRRGADRVRRRGTGHGLVDSRGRMEPLRVPLPEDAARRGRPGAHADHHAHRQRAAPRLSRGGARRLRRDVAAPERRRAGACKATLSPAGRRPAGPPDRAVRDALEDDPDRADAARPLRVEHRYSTSTSRTRSAT